MQRKTLLIFVPLLLIVLTITLILLRTKPKNSHSNIPSGQTYEIILGENGFTPNEINIKPGDKVKFSTTLKDPFWPASDLHPTHGIYPEFDPLEPVGPTNTWSFQFLNPGKWKYHDHLQPVFRGVITVR